MGKKDKEELSKDKQKKKHKLQKTSKNQFKQPSSSLHECEDIDVENDGNDTPTSVNQSRESFENTEENVDVEVEAEGEGELLDENQTKSEVPSTAKSTLKVEVTKKPLKKIDNTEVVNSKPLVSVSFTIPKKSKRRRDSGTSSEEERWLTAVESGKLEEIEDVELRKIKDPKLMTARQRAMYDRNNDTETAPGFSETLMALPTGYKEKEKPQTAEELQKAALKILKRKQQADEKREKDKKKTMERLLKKQESKYRAGNKSKLTKELISMISYKNYLEGSVIQMPIGMEFPLAAQTPKEPPKQQLCGIAGCCNLKVYNCSKTNLPLCSFACYRKNVQSLKEIIC